MSSKEIRRRIEIGGNKVWIRANSEQEYADKIIERYRESIGAEEQSGHNFRVFAEKWFEVFAKPNVRKGSQTSYRRQLDVHIYPVLGEKDIEDITVADAMQVFNAMGDENTIGIETKKKVRTVLNQILCYAIDEKIISKNPLEAYSFRIRGKESEPTKAYTVEQMPYIIEHLRDIRHTRIEARPSFRIAQRQGRAEGRWRWCRTSRGI